jgi:predicted small secreted protein
MKSLAHRNARIVGSMLSVFALGCAVALSACNTTAGVGKDVSATGNAVSNSAEKVKQGL